MGLNANSGGHRTPVNDQEKWMFGFGRVCGLVCTIAVSFGNSSFFSRWRPYWKAFEFLLKIFTVFSEYTYCWMFIFVSPAFMLSGKKGSLRHPFLWRRRRRLSSQFVFRTVSQKWLVRFNSNLACGCNWSWGCAV